MPIYYKLFKNNRKEGKMAGKWYACVAPVKTISLQELSEHMAAHNTPFSAGTIKGISHRHGGVHLRADARQS